MNSPLTALERPAAAVQFRSVLAQDGFACTHLTLAPGARTAPPSGLPAGDQVLYVLAGTVAVHDGVVTTLVNGGEAALLTSGAVPVLAARGSESVRALLLEIPARRPVLPSPLAP